MPPRTLVAGVPAQDHARRSTTRRSQSIARERRGLRARRSGCTCRAADAEPRSTGGHDRLRRALPAPRRASSPRLGRVAVAFSGGVDSSVLLHAAHAALGARAVGADRRLAVAAAPRARRRARARRAAIGARLEVLATDELDDPRYQRERRRPLLLLQVRPVRAPWSAWARAHGFRALAFGEITDDLARGAPGRARRARVRRRRAAVARRLLQGRRAPLRARARPRRGREARQRLPRLAPPGRHARSPASASRASRRSEAAMQRPRLRAKLRVRDHCPRARVEVGEDELVRAPSASARRSRRCSPARASRRFELAAYRRPAAPSRADGLRARPIAGSSPGR